MALRFDSKILMLSCVASVGSVFARDLGTVVIHLITLSSPL